MKGCFKGDADELVEALTEACKKPSTTAPLQERKLVPFFSPSQAANADFAPLQYREGATPSKSAAAKGAENAKARPASAGANKSAKHRREPAATATKSGDGRSLLAARPVDTTPGRRPASTPPAVSSLMYAGPGFTNSPMPETLPLPTSSLLLMEGLRRQLVL
ncbi:hypothetical protein QBZ16_000208 [Prototheca wickerhamii]|uniref:Uncharacterized protein n=1 Tax=Prototheca wickerhamii TaxID=3111 RepID=A0AAD9MLX4_PROWI|nr:hypothetical protein QBZ16_000208 [Prototheca wickerhamii]